MSTNLMGQLEHIVGQLEEIACSGEVRSVLPAGGLETLYDTMNLLEKHDKTIRSLFKEIQQLRFELAQANCAGESDFWIWSDTNDNYLESMTELMTIQITAGQLRRLLDKDANSK